MKVLLLENISAVALEQFRAAGYEVESHKAALEERDLVEKVRGAAILGVRSKTPVSKAVIQAGEKLVAVGAFCIGVDKIDRATALMFSSNRTFKSPSMEPIGKEKHTDVQDKQQMRFVGRKLQPLAA